jgi:hypothetical protein
MESHMIVRSRGSHIFSTIGWQMEVRLSSLLAERALPRTKSHDINFCYRLCQPQGHGAAERIRANKQTPWPESTNELYQPSNFCLSAKIVSTFVDRLCHMVSFTDPYSDILRFLDRSRYFFLQVAPQLYLRG